MKPLKGFSIWLMVCFFCAAAAAQSPTYEAIVGVQSYLSNEKALQGTGFFISGEGNLLTCYHSVKDADRITVHYRGNSYPARVSRIAAKHDLAMLSVEASGQVPFISLYGGPPDAAMGSELLVIGHALGMNSLQTTARLAKGEWQQSELFRAPNGVRLFSPGTPLLILEARAIHDGMSGAPVLYGERALGVLCGSVSTGGDIAWAMKPGEAFGGDSRGYGSAPDRLIWPTFALVRGSQWRNLLRSASAGEERVQKVARYISLWEKEEDLYYKHLAALSAFREKVDEWIPLVRQASVGGSPGWMLQDLQRQIQAEATGLLQAHRVYMEAYDERFQASLALFDLGWELMDAGYPNTPRNTEVVGNFISESGKRLREEQEEGYDPETAIAEMDARFERRDRLEELVSKSYGSFSQMLAELTDIRQLALREWEDRLELREGDNRSREQMALVESMLFLDRWTDSWSYAQADYEIRFPPGWSLVDRSSPAPALKTVLDQIGGWYAGRGSRMQDCVVNRNFESLFVCLGSYATDAGLEGNPVQVGDGTGAYLIEYPTQWTFVRIPNYGRPGYLEIACVYDGIERQAAVRTQCKEIAGRVRPRSGGGR